MYLNVIFKYVAYCYLQLQDNFLHFRLQVTVMKYFIKFAFIGFAFLCTSLSIASPVILKPITAPEPTEFSSVNGVVGLISESLTGGTISVEAGSYSQTTPLEANGNFNLTVAANSIYTIKATLGLDATLPDVTASFKNYPALLQGETRTFDLRRPSGQLLVGLM